MELRSSEDLTDIIKKEFPGAVLDDSFNGRQRYHVPKDTVTISEGFEKLLQLSKKYNIQDFAFTQSTLEQVFIMFAREQPE